jgi:hypothetical protein
MRHLAFADSHLIPHFPPLLGETTNVVVEIVACLDNSGRGVLPVVLLGGLDVDTKLGESEFGGSFVLKGGAQRRVKVSKVG